LRCRPGTVPPEMMIANKKHGTWRETGKNVDGGASCDTWVFWGLGFTCCCCEQQQLVRRGNKNDIGLIGPCRHTTQVCRHTHASVCASPRDTDPDETTQYGAACPAGKRPPLTPYTPSLLLEGAKTRERSPRVAVFPASSHRAARTDLRSKPAPTRRASHHRPYTLLVQLIP
jgi:hypothetical protein